MELSHQTITRILERYNDGSSDHITDTASEYGEPGYSHRWGATTPLILLGDYWCRCEHNPRGDAGKFHDIMSHHPRVWAQLESQGVQCEWYDEWWVDYETGKAWRTEPNSYGWQPSIIWCEDMCDYLTPDHDAEDWITWAANDTARIIPRVVGIDLASHGFTRWPDDSTRFESGWHPGQTDDPKVITDNIRAEHGDAVDIVFYLDSTGQFDIAFSAWTRPVEDEGED